MENTESIAYHRRTAEGTFADAVQVDNAKKRVITKDDIGPGGAMLRRQVCVWHLWYAKMPSGVEPKCSDVVRDYTGARWVIDVVDVQSFEDRYRLECTRENA